MAYNIQTILIDQNMIFNKKDAFKNILKETALPLYRVN